MLHNRTHKQCSSTRLTAVATLPPPPQVYHIQYVRLPTGSAVWPPIHPPTMGQQASARPRALRRILVVAIRRQPANASRRATRFVHQ